MPRLIQVALILAFSTLIALGPMLARASAAAGARFGMQPVTYNPDVPASKSYFILDTEPGMSLENQVRVVNSGTARGSVHLYPVDATTGQTGGTVFLGRDAPRQDAATWITLDSTELTLDPGQSSIVPFQVVVPANAAPGQHVAGIVAEDAELQEGTGGNAAPNGVGFRVNIQNLTILAVQLNLAGQVTEHMTVSGITAGGAGGFQALLLNIRNDGSALVKPVGTLTVTDARGQELQQLSLKLDTFLPRTEIQYPVAIERQALDVGRYHAKVQLTYGKSGVTTYEGEFTVTSEQVAQAFPEQPRQPLAPPTSASVPSTVGTRTASLQWRLFAGAGAILVAVLLGGFFLGRRGRSTGTAK